MIATRLSSVWQVAGVAAAALCCYLVSQSVAAERAGLGKVDRDIQRAHDDIARLQNELGVRGRMKQLESWNTQVLELKAPKPSQFVGGSAQLVALYARNGRPVLPLDQDVLATRGDTTRVAFQQAPAPVQTKPAIVPVADREIADAPPAQPLLHNAAYVRARPERLAPEAAPIVRVADRPAALASLLPADISAIAAAERGGKGSRAKADR
jgi:hypothetical protein